MKKPTKKLSLSGQTIRHLQTGDLAHVNGGSLSLSGTSVISVSSGTSVITPSGGIPSLNPSGGRH